VPGPDSLTIEYHEVLAFQCTECATIRRAARSVERTETYPEDGSTPPADATAASTRFPA
jgi:hypothetical protein